MAATRHKKDLHVPFHRACRVLAVAWIFLQFSSQASAQGPDRAQFAQWGLEVYAETVETLGLAGSPLFAESVPLNGRQFGGAGGQAYVWPLSTQFRSVCRTRWPGWMQPNSLRCCGRIPISSTPIIGGTAGEDIAAA